MTFQQVFGGRLRTYRETKGLSQKELAQTIGVSTSCVSQYECGNRMPNLITLSLLADALGCLCDNLVPEVKKEPEPDENQTTIFDYMED